MKPLIIILFVIFSMPSYGQLKANERAIVPIESWNVQQNKTDTLNVFRLVEFHGYDFLNGGGSVKMQIGFYSNGKFVNRLSSEVPIPAAVVASWGADDSVIFNYVIQAKNLTLQ